MIGFPKTINSRQDLINLLAEPAFKPKALTMVQTLMDERYNWVLQGQLDVNATTAAEAGYKIVDIKNDEGVVTQRYLYRWMVDPNNTLARLGIPTAEAVAWGGVDNAVVAPAQ
jgi:hypothetical protein